MARTCGAKTRSGTPCKRSPLAGKTRCRLHGGASISNQNAKTHGIYASTLTETERNQWNDVQIGSIDEELKLCRLRLVRALKAENENGAKPELDEVTVKTSKSGGTPGGEKKFRRRDYVGIIDKIMARIESLEKTRLHLLNEGAAGWQSKGDFMSELVKHLPD